MFSMQNLPDHPYSCHNVLRQSLLSSGGNASDLTSEQDRHLLHLDEEQNVYMGRPGRRWQCSVGSANDELAKVGPGGTSTLGT
eukprot:scaffold179779_cov51-Prasinocladus_malaysianus.AAC.2